MTKTAKKPKLKPLRKTVEYWTPDDFRYEAMRMNGDDDPESDANACAAMMLAALREGPADLDKLASATGIRRDRLEWMRSA